MTLYVLFNDGAITHYDISDARSEDGRREAISVNRPVEEPIKVDKNIDDDTIIDLMDDYIHGQQINTVVRFPIS